MLYCYITQVFLVAQYRLSLFTQYRLSLVTQYRPDFLQLPSTDQTFSSHLVQTFSSHLVQTFSSHLVQQTFSSYLVQTRLSLVTQYRLSLVTQYILSLVTQYILSLVTQYRLSLDYLLFFTIFRFSVTSIIIVYLILSSIVRDSDIPQKMQFILTFTGRTSHDPHQPLTFQILFTFSLFTEEIDSSILPYKPEMLLLFLEQDTEHDILIL